MTKDLERTLDELGPDFRKVVRRLQGARTVGRPPQTFVRFRPLLAASLLAAFGLVAVWLAVGPRGEAARAVPVRPAVVPREYALADLRTDEAVRELIRTQRADGGWSSDFLTRRNAAALRRSPAPEAQVAYRRAVRNLRLRGVL